MPEPGGGYFRGQVRKHPANRLKYIIPPGETVGVIVFLEMIKIEIQDGEALPAQNFLQPVAYPRYFPADL